MKVCILTAGKGTRMGITHEWINKALLPIKNKAIISHLIDFFPSGTDFVIACGYLGDQVRDYLAAAHPNTLFQFVSVENYEGFGSGPGLSLLYCESFLQEPFFYVPCDCILKGDLKNIPDGNWVGVSPVDTKSSESYCNVAVQDGKVIEIRDKEPCGDDYLAFTAPLFVKNYKLFWESLKDPHIIKNERQISNGIKGLIRNSQVFAVKREWINMGDAEKYYQAQDVNNSFDFSKPDEFIYFVNNRVIKFFANKKIVEGRIKKAELKPEIFPIVTKSGDYFYYYPYSSGQIFYSCGTPELFVRLLNWLDENVWHPVNVEPKKMQKLCYEFYYIKTINRLNEFKNKNPNYKFPSRINNEVIPSLSELLDKIPWKILCSGKPTFIHGDLNFHNLLYEKEVERFLLIDWRQDFAGEIEFGDLYYDLAKMLAGIIINYEFIKKNQFQVMEDVDDIIIDYKKWEDGKRYQQLLEEFMITKNLDINRVHLLAAITYLNMAPLHNYPFNYFLITFGTQMISQELNKNLK